MLRIILSHAKLCKSHTRYFATVKQKETRSDNHEFETVFSFPFIRYIALVNRLKVYQLLGTTIIVPASGILETLNVVPSGVCLSATYIGLTTATVMSLATIPFKNIIGFIYISKDSQTIKISYLDFWGRRKEKLVPVDEWIPLLELNTKVIDVLYLSPELKDGSKYKLFVKFGNVLNAKKMEEVLE